MAQEIGESREQWGWDIWQKAEEIANNLKSDKKPFYIVFAAKDGQRRIQVPFDRGFPVY